MAGLIKTETKVDFTDEQIDKWLQKSTAIRARKICGILGEPETGKSSLALSYFDKKLKANKDSQIIVLDLDGGCADSLQHFPDTASRMIVKNPQQKTNDPKTGEKRIDYAKSMSLIRSVADFIAKNHAKKKIVGVVVDGLSKMLQYSESQMRIEKSLDAAGGVQMGFWKLRNKLFLETIDIITATPIDVFFIGHSNFIMGDDDSASAVVEQLNASFHQRIITTSRSEEGIFRFYGKITKSKTTVTALNEEASYFAMKKTEKKTIINFNGDKIWGILK